MSAKKKEEEVKSGNSKLKKIASAFNKHINQQYQDSVSYIPNTSEVAKVSVSKWVEMPDAFQDAVELKGLPVGNVTHVYGKPNTGKTTMLMEGIACAQEQGILPILILTEHKFSFDRLYEYMGAAADELLVIHAASIENAFSIIEKLIKNIEQGQIVFENEQGSDEVIKLDDDDTCYIFMDSLGNTMSDSELEYEVEESDKSMGRTAKVIKNGIKRVNQLLGRKNVRQRCGVLFLNQSYQSMPSYGPSVETPYGGEGVIYSCVLNIRLKRKKDISMMLKGKKTIIGLETIIQVKKNHITHKQCESTVYTVATGMLPPDKKKLDEYKKQYMK
jgi:recombination protein RecA